MATDAEQPVLIAQGVSKHFGATRALEDVSFSVRAGERLAILGENGAGKSTLIKVIAGVHRPDVGTMTLSGESYAPDSPAAALRSGVSVVYQEPSFFARMSVLENMFIGREERDRLGQMNYRVMRRRTRDLFSRLGIESLDLDRAMGDLSLAQQQLVLIARAVDVDSRVLILDEPTSILTNAEAGKLFAIMDTLAASGVSILYITHRFDELERAADRFLILKDGRAVGEQDAIDIDHDHILSLMAGREIDKSVTKKPRAQGARALTVRGLSVRGRVRSLDLHVDYGEVVGLYGLVGSGRSEVALSIVGALESSAGTFELDGAAFTPRSVRDSIDRGIAYLPEDRKTLGIFDGLSITANLTASVMRRHTGFLGRLKRGELRGITREWVNDLSIKTETVESSIGTLSGGHQQKTLLARQLATDPRLLILDEPTRGIDVATKTVIQQRIVDAAAAGMALVVISSELPELLTVADRVIVMRSGAAVADLSGDRMTEENVLRSALGVAA